MRVHYHMRSLPHLGQAVLSIGFFDGVHRGHQRLIARTAELALQQQARSVLVTFWPHPLVVVRPATRITLLSTLEEKLATLSSLGTLDDTVVIPFTPELAQMDPEGFLDLLGKFCTVRSLVEGNDFALGHNRAGDLEYLRTAGVDRGFSVEGFEVLEEGERVSSTRIRGLVSEGNVASAAQLLGRPYALSGLVVQGDQRGRLIGFPTANLQVDDRKLLPANGVFAVRVGLPGEPTPKHDGVCNVGIRPTFDGGTVVRVEVHLLDVAADLYGLNLTLEFVDRLRSEQKFAGIDELRAQIARDVQHARKILGDAGATRA